MGLVAHSRHRRPSKLPRLTSVGQTDSANPREPLGQRGSQPGQGHPATTFNLFSQAAADSLHLSSCDRGWWQLQAGLCWPCTPSWASPLWPSRGWHHPSLSAAPARHLGGSSGSSLVGTAGSTSTCLIRRTCQKHFSLPYTTLTAAVILYDAIYSTPSKPISVFTAKWSVKNG